ncbi:Ku protein [Bdellovibrio sp. qaytius]|nr:Ku protein [Bdellovibrio sp. qaytius]
MARALWSGAISFGLLNIPVAVLSAKEDERISFRMLDKRNNSPIGYKQYTKATGKEVDKKNIVKAYEYEKNQFVTITEDELKKVNPKATQTIDIEDFVNLKDVDFLLFEKPYYLVPGKNGEKGYVLLRDILQDTQKAAVAKFVLHNRQHLVTIIPREDYLILEVMRFQHEVTEVSEAKHLDDYDLSKVKVSPREMKAAKALVDEMTEKWKPDKYRDTYQDELKKYIKHKVKVGDVEAAAEFEEAPKSTDTNSADLMTLLQKSVLRGKVKKPKTTHSTRLH